MSHTLTVKAKTEHQQGWTDFFAGREPEESASITYWQGWHEAMNYGTEMIQAERDETYDAVNRWRY